MSMQYWANINGTQHGPVQKEQLLDLGLTPESYVWRDGLEEWIQVKELEELSDLFPTEPKSEPKSENSEHSEHSESPVAPSENSEISEHSEFSEPLNQTPPPIPEQPVQPIVEPIQLPYYQQPVQPVYPYQAPQQPSEPCPPTNLVWAILTIIFCCQVFGIIALVFAAQVRSKYNEGDLEKAQKYSDRAAAWSIAAIVVGMLYMPFAIIIQLLALMA